MTIGLVQVDGKLPNLALMKISNYYKQNDTQVEFAQSGRQYEKVYASVLFSWDREKAEALHDVYDNLEIGGTGYDLAKTLPPEIEMMKPDYDLYSEDMIYNMVCRGIKNKEAIHKKAKTIADMGIGFLSRGCIRNCGFCIVKQKEGNLRQESRLEDILNPRSNVVTLYDNNLTADPYCVEKLHEIRDRKLVVDISQGVDVRLMTDEKAEALSEVKHLRSLHYAWDLMSFEKPVLAGIKLLTQHVKPYKHMCYVLCGYNTTFVEDMYRVQTLHSLGVIPYVMKYNNSTEDIRLNHFARWVNGHFYKSCDFNEYTPYVKTLQRKTA